ncbi:MAG: hypothetical protein LC802_08100 [Acidobacteria bacterium]|nr:hypothetical protein [Acidobacteriota bacterium]
MAEDSNDNYDGGINFVKEALKSEYNLGFIGVMAFLMLVVNFWAFLPLLFAGQLGAALLAQMPIIQRYIKMKKVWQRKENDQETEKRIVALLPANYQTDFHSVRALCEEIERRSAELGTGGAGRMLADVVAKLSSFRYEYARMLRARHLLSTRNYRQLQHALAQQIEQAEEALKGEEARQVRYALTQNLSILRQRQARIKRLDELVRLLDARLQVIKNSLGLIQDEVYTFTDVAGIQGLVDNLLINLSISDEFRAEYEDVLNVEAEGASLSALESVSASTAAAGGANTTENAAERARRAQKQVQRTK